MAFNKNEGKAPKGGRKGASQAQAQQQGGVGNSTPKRNPGKMISKGYSR